MQPHIQIFLKQISRSKARLALNLILLCATTAFFVLSLNLYQNSVKNLQTVENAYTSIATMEIYGDVNKMGELVHPGDKACVGRHWLSVEEYDLSPLLALDSVERIDLRTRVGAYIPGQIAILQDNTVPPAYLVESVTPFSTNNIIRFMLDAEEPTEISLQAEKWQWMQFPIRVLDTSNPNLQYPKTFTLRIEPVVMEEAKKYTEDIRRLNRSEVSDRIILHPGVEYVMSVKGGSYWQRDEETGVYVWTGDYAGSGSGIQLDIYPFDYYTDDFLYYSKSGIHNSNVSNSSTLLQKMPFALQRYEDVKDDPVWKECSQGIEYSAHSFIATLTDDISLIPAWYQGAMYLHEGRMITKAEYASGAKVCMVSAQMAEYQGWQVGDTLDMHLYIYDAFYDKTSVIHNATMQQNYMSSPVFLNECGGFFEEDTYEIVGIFGQQEFTDFGSTAPQVFFAPWNAIYIPAKAAPNAPEGPIQPSLITIELKNGSINEFKAAAEEMGLTEQKSGEYELKLSYFDQGYDKIQPGLIEMNKNAKLLLGLSAALLAVTMVLMAFLFAQQHKHSAGILRMLGGSKKQAFIAILTCAAVVVLAGGALGTILGGALTQSVGASILGDTAESAKVALSTGASPLLTALTGIACMALFLLLTAIFTGMYIGKEPRALLPEDKN